jgi:hypothetical protein
MKVSSEVLLCTKKSTNSGVQIQYMSNLSPIALEGAILLARTFGAEIGVVCAFMWVCVCGFFHVRKDQRLFAETVML